MISSNLNIHELSLSQSSDKWFLEANHQRIYRNSTLSFLSVGQKRITQNFLQNPFFRIQDMFAIYLSGSVDNLEADNPKFYNCTKFPCHPVVGKKSTASSKIELIVL